jgi:flavodoxin
MGAGFSRRLRKRGGCGIFWIYGGCGMVIYFSGTENSKYIADRIAASLQEKLLCMNERIKSGNTGSVKTGENLIVVVPTYAWRIPRVVSDWIGQTEFVGTKNVWYVMSCGSGIGGADI